MLYKTYGVHAKIKFRLVITETGSNENKLA